MKLQSNNLLSSLTNDDIKILTSEVKETLSPDFRKDKRRVFSSAELWNIYRRRQNTFGRKVL